jgi:hypothetical protein
MAVFEDVTAERIAKNQATFRDANEQIEKAAEEHGVPRPPFICECADPRCTELVELDLPTYEAIRSNPTHFFVVPGHEGASGRHGEVIREAATTRSWRRSARPAM